MRATNLIIAGCLWLLAGCASPRPAEVALENSAAQKLPPEISINPDAGRGNLLVINVRVAGKERPFVVDTGAGITCVSQSLAAELGPPVGTVRAYHWDEVLTNQLYAMPAMYLGDTRLQGGKRVMAMDLRTTSILSEETVEGIVGMDVLSHYCVQVDFAANKLRFLEDSSAGKSDWGRAFPIRPVSDRDPRPMVSGNLLGEKAPHSIIDSGYLGAGWLTPKHFAQWTNQAAARSPDTAYSPDARFLGEAYPELT